MKLIRSLFTLTLTGISSFTVNAQTKNNKVYESEGQKFTVETLTQQEDVIWGFDFLSPKEIIFTERKGALKRFHLDSKKIENISGLPKVEAIGQGGLLDVRVLPQDAKRIYLTYTAPAEKKQTTTALAVATLDGSTLKDLKTIFTAHSPTSESIHYGSRIEFDDKGHLWTTIGDRNTRKNVQSLEYHNGKTIRLKLDGSVPHDNPFVKNKSARPEIWSLGHRSPQGLVRNPQTGDLWLTEMGPRGGDELNLIKPGLNYGWPEVTYGREYWGPKIGVQKKEGTEPPITYWVPSISPSGMTYYNSTVFPKWQGSLFLANLSSTHLRRLAMEGHRIAKQEELLSELGLRIRNVRPGPDGFLYLSTDEGHLMRLVPATSEKAVNTKN